MRVLVLDSNSGLGIAFRTIRTEINTGHYMEVTITTVSLEHVVHLTLYATVWQLHFILLKFFLSHLYFLNAKS